MRFLGKHLPFKDQLTMSMLKYADDIDAVSDSC